MLVALSIFQKFGAKGNGVSASSESWRSRPPSSRLDLQWWDQLNPRLGEGSLDFFGLADKRVVLSDKKGIGKGGKWCQRDVVKI